VNPAEPEIQAAFDVYFRALCHPDATAEELLETAVTQDFETGFANGFRWKGADGLRAFLAARAGFVDERHEVKEILGVESASATETAVRTRLEFFLRQPDSAEELTGSAFHSWRLRADPDGGLRVAAQIVDGFADLNEPAARLFATPEKGLNR
jgi:hypothetical protein